LKRIALSHITKRYRLDEETAARFQKETSVRAGFPPRARDGYFYALDDVSLSIDEGEFCVTAGANGSGKSALMAVIAGLDSPSSGTRDVSALPGIVFQDADSQILGETPREDVAVGPKNLKFSRERIERTVSDSLEAVGLSRKADFPARSLSGGEKRRLSLAGVLAMDCGIVIFDEPYANLDVSGVRDVNAALEELKAQKKTVILLTHELEKCLALADRFFALAEGRLVFDGSPEDALAQEGAESVFESWGIRHPFSRAETLGDLLWK
jgi:biotin transport system ATP-binding protein